MLELCLVKVFEKFLHLTFEKCVFFFRISVHCLMGTIQQGTYYLTRLYISTGMVHNVNGT